MKLSVEVEPELRRRVKIAAANKDQSIKEWIQGAILHELEYDGEEELTLPPAGVKPRGAKDPPKPKGGGNPISQAVIEDRR